MVSVIIPVFNAEKTLLSCVQSVLAQTYKDFEMILIDDGSFDHSRQICDDTQKICSAKGIKCQVIHQKNSGVSSARNRGMNHANGEFFVFVDSDDVVAPCYLDDLIRTAEMYSNLGHVLCGFRCTSHVHDYVFSTQHELSFIDRSSYMQLYDKVLVQSPCLALYRTEIIRKKHIKMREDISLAEDILFNLEYLDALDYTSIGVVNKVNYIYRNEDPNSLYRKYRQDLLTIYEMVNRALAEYLEKWDIIDESSRKKYYATAFCNYENVLDNTFHKQNPMSLREKINYNNTIMKSEDFRNILQKIAATLLPAQRKAYQSGDYKQVLAYKQSQKIKTRIIKILK